MGRPAFMQSSTSAESKKGVDFWGFRILNVPLHLNYCGVEQLVARWAHNPKVASSSLAPATTQDNPPFSVGLSFLSPSVSPINKRFSLNRRLTFDVRYWRFLVSIRIPSGNTSFCILCFCSNVPDVQYLLTFCEQTVS